MKDILSRALNTFWQAGLSYVLMSAEEIFLSGEFDFTTILGILAAGFIGAGASAVANSIKRAWQQK